MRRPSCSAALLAVAVALLASAPPAAAKPYKSPGYKGSKGFAKVTPKPLPASTLGTGKYPDLLVDAAGTAHVTYTQDGGTDAPDTLATCNLQRGIKACASSGAAPNPEAPPGGSVDAFEGNFPGGNHDFDGPVPLAIGNQLFVVQRRFPDVFTTPDRLTSDSNVFEWSSVDGGATLTGPGQIGDNQMAGGAIAYGDPAAPSIGTISRTQTGGTTFQGTQPGQYTTAKALLGTGDQAYDGSLALDGDRPIAAFADLSGNVIVREWSGEGDVNDADTWSSASFPGNAPRIVGGPAGVFVLSSDSNINGGKLSLRRIVNSQPTADVTALGTSSSQPAIAEDASGRIAVATTDDLGIHVRTSATGTGFSPPELVAALPAGAPVASLATAVTADGGGFVSFVRDPVGAEGVGAVTLAAFGTQLATGKPGLGPLPGGGIGSAVGDELATSTCQSAKFGAVEARITAGCFAHDPSNPNLDVTTGELNVNGVRIIPDAGVRIGVDPKRHTIDTTGKVRVLLSAPGVDITLWHDEIHARIPSAVPGADLFDFDPPTAPIVAGFPVEGHVDVKIIDGGVQVPVSLELPGEFGGVTGSATLVAKIDIGLQLDSLEFKVGDVNLAALELKDVDVTYTREGEAWKGTATLWVPAGGSALRATLEVDFDHGGFNGGRLDLGLPYPGIPLDAVNTPPQLYLSSGGLGFTLRPDPTLTGTMGLGVTPFLPPGEGGARDYAFSLDGRLAVSFGRPVTITVAIDGGYLNQIKIGEGSLVYKIPNQVQMSGAADFRLGFIKFSGRLGAIIDPEHDVYGARIKTEAKWIMPDPFGDVSIPGFSLAINNEGFAAYIPPPGLTLPIPPFTFFGTIAYRWGDTAPKPFPYQDMTGRFAAGIPVPPGRRAAVHGHAAQASGFGVPEGAPTASLVVHGAGAPPDVVLIAPDGSQVTPDQSVGPAGQASAIADPTSGDTTVGIKDPAPGRWQVATAPGSANIVTGFESSIGVPRPTVRATLSGKGAGRRTVRYTAGAVPAGAAIGLFEQGKGLLRRVGQVRAGTGTLRFRPAPLPAGRRTLIARITGGDGLPVADRSLATYTVPKPPRPGRAKKLKVRAGRRAFTYSYRRPADATQVLVRIVATDGRHLQRLVKPSVRRGTVPVIGFRDGITVTVVGIGADGTRGRGVSAKARRRT